MRISGQAAMITGGAFGLGEATARELAHLGAKVALLDVNLALADTVAAQIGAEFGDARAVACQGNITSIDSMVASLAASITFPPRPGKPDEFAQSACHVATNRHPSLVPCPFPPDLSPNPTGATQ